MNINILTTLYLLIDKYEGTIIAYGTDLESFLDFKKEHESNYFYTNYMLYKMVTYADNRTLMYFLEEDVINKKDIFTEHSVHDSLLYNHTDLKSTYLVDEYIWPEDDSTITPFSKKKTWK